MNTLQLKFAVSLGNDALRHPRAQEGPQFTFWLPDGRNSAIPLPTGHVSASLSVWFERCGTVGEHGIVFDVRKRGVLRDGDVSRQAVCSGGPLFGELILSNVPADEFTAVTCDRMGDAAYVELGKRLVDHLLVPPLRRFVDKLRLHYGQYWLEPIPVWDSRRRSLGAYFQLLQLKWQLPGEDKTKPFAPDKPAIQFAVTLSDDFSAFISSDDWTSIASELALGQDFPTELSLLAESRRLIEHDELGHALVVACTATELSLNRLIRGKKSGGPGAGKIESHLDQLLDLGLSAKFAIVTLLQPPKHGDAKQALKAIDHRNKFVHDGVSPPAGAQATLAELLTVCASIAGSIVVRQPNIRAGNTWNASTEDDKEGGETLD